jgi:anti-sigma factor RsiW
VSNAPRPNPKTVEALLDTTWRVAVAETGRTDSLDRKASTLATFSSLLASFTATLPEQVHGDVMSTLIAAVTRERRRNREKARTVRWGSVALLLGLVLIAGEAAILASRSVFE